MHDIIDLVERRTTTDVVFDQLHADIVSLKLFPGTKLSEADVARRFGVSRQPVRDAFNRLEHLDLLLIRPQRATEVRGFSLPSIANARFVRLSVELEVIRRACLVWDDARAAILEENLNKQRIAIDNGQSDQFHSLDTTFHQLIFVHGGCPLAVDTIKTTRQQIDRLCVLSLGRKSEAATLLEDHQKLAHALRNGSIQGATTIVRQHLSRLDDTIDDIHLSHAEYFE